jgi:plastocyanin
MRKYILISFLLSILFSGKVFGNIHIIQASGVTFTPSQVNATVGDTIKWQWIDGAHNTISLAVPSGAVSWNSLLDTLHPTFVYVLTTAGTYNYECSFHVAFGMTGSIAANPNAVIHQNSEVPEEYNLYQNYPNPFNPSTQIKFDIPRTAFTRVTVYDIIGNELVNLVNENLQAGRYTVTWDAANYPSGVYLYKIVSGGYTVTKKMMLIK